jgi:CheY-like chemotaxis protein
VRSIVLQHEGFIRALDVVNAADEVTGAAFEIFLPLVQRAPARQRRPQSGPHMPAGNGELVLVVDDDELMRRLGERVLRESGYRVITAIDGRAAIETYAAHLKEIELVVLDIVMPEMGGRAVSERIRELDPSARFLFTSGYTMSIQDTEFVQDPRRRFLPKPFNAGQLLREVSQALDAKL